MIDDTDYLFRRAEQELAMAAASEVTEAVRAHCLLAERYLDQCCDRPADEGQGELARR